MWGSIPKFICKFFFLIQDTFFHGKKLQMAFRATGLPIKVYFLHNISVEICICNGSE